MLLLNRLTPKATSIVLILAAFPFGLTAQIQMPNIGRTSTPQQQSQQPQPQSKNLLMLDELNTLDAKFHKELDAAQEAFDREKFGDAEQAFAQLTTEIGDLIKRIAGATLQKNGFLEVDGVRKPATTQTETEWFTRILVKAQHGENGAKILRNVTDIQKQAMDLLSAGKYPEDRDAYRKSTEALVANRSQLDDPTFQFFSARSDNGRKESITSFWAKEFRRLRDNYNRTTEDAKMSTEEIRRTIKSVADEINGQGYMDPVKHPDMPDDARALFRTLLDAAYQYLGSQ